MLYNVTRHTFITSRVGRWTRKVIGIGDQERQGKSRDRHLVEEYLEEGEVAYRMNEEVLQKNYEEAIRGDEGEKWRPA